MKIRREGSYLVNSDSDEFTKYIQLRKLNESREFETIKQKEEILSLKSELEQIKILIKGLSK